MKTTLFHLPSKEIAKSKCSTVLCMAIIIISLYTTCYMLFFRTVIVDVTKDAAITYQGESAFASVKVMNRNKNYNQRIQEFMDSITYKVTPQTELKNGDTITITATYDKELASRYHVDPIQSQREVLVSDLPVRYEHADKIPKEYFKKIEERGETYLEKYMDAILSEDFTSFYINAKPKLLGSTLSYRIFLDSSGPNKDKLVDIYAITAKGEVNTSSEGEVLEEQEKTIYYMITYNEINTSMNILDENVYGEKIIVHADMDISNPETFMALMNAKYSAHYVVTPISLEQ